VLARTTDIAVLGDPAEVIGNGHGTGNLAAERCSQPLDPGEVLPCVQSPADGDHRCGVADTRGGGDRRATQDAHRARISRRQFLHVDRLIADALVVTGSAGRDDHEHRAGRGQGLDHCTPCCGPLDDHASLFWA